MYPRQLQETNEKIGYTIRDDLSDPTEQYLIDLKKQLLKDHEIVTKNEVEELEMRFSKVSNDLEELDKRLEGDKEYTNTKIDEIENRLEKLETSKKNMWKPRNINLKSN